MSEPIYWISGPPAAGKSTFCEALIQSFERGIVIPVDDIREWVRSGYASPVPWTDETESQYRTAEEAACLLALKYQSSQFAVIIDACRSPSRIDELVAHELSGHPVIKVLLLPSIEENMRRAHTRSNKNFDPHFLDDIIRHTHARYSREASSDWEVIDNTALSVEEEVAKLQIAARLTSRD